MIGPTSVLTPFLERDATVTFQNIIQRIHPDDREEVERAVRRAVADRARL